MAKNFVLRSPPTIERSHKLVAFRSRESPPSVPKSVAFRSQASTLSSRSIATPLISMGGAPPPLGPCRAALVFSGALSSLTGRWSGGPAPSYRTLPLRPRPFAAAAVNPGGVIGVPCVSMYAGAAPLGGFIASPPAIWAKGCFAGPSAWVDALVRDYIRTIILHSAPFLEYLTSG